MIWGVQPLFQRKDTYLLCLDGCSLSGKHAWDKPHETKSADDVHSCDHCNKYCGFASIAMINHWYGGNLSEEKIG
ncbi:hypothetical protein DRP04_12925 [Archaeoglobales archaeon]|nr:MAG: hypothetical protein DRP04_12925 [Archaeoglobales archaeon]